MNRIKISPLATADTVTAQPDGNDAPERAGKQPPLNNRQPASKQARNAESAISLFVPMHYEKKYAYPLIVWLHGNGSDSRQLNQIMPHVSMRNYVGVAPQAPDGNFEAGYFWDDDPISVESSHEAIIAAIDQASAKLNIAPQRIFLAGEGEGGTMAFRIAFERPDLFAGVVSIDGPIPVTERPLLKWTECREMPVFWAHWRNSPTFEQSTLCEQLRLLHIAGFTVNLRQYPSAETLESKVFADFDQWIMEMINSAVRNPR